MEFLNQALLVQYVVLDWPFGKALYMYFQLKFEIKHELIWT